MKISGKVYAKPLPLCLVLGLKCLQVSRACTWYRKLNVKWGKARTNCNLHLPLTASNPRQATCGSSGCLLPQNGMCTWPRTWRSWRGPSGKWRCCRPSSCLHQPGVPAGLRWRASCCCAWCLIWPPESNGPCSAPPSKSQAGFSNWQS